ncbi:MAG: hypothetical protein GXO17_04780 [Thermodesulfobacteria bacterium]|nr:hypothetical protein [Thermodesulfobacteriota bacterium]
MEWKKPNLVIDSLQPDPADPLSFLKERGADLRDEKWLDLCGLVLELSVDSETTMLRFLEGQPRDINWDKIERRRYLLSGTVRAFRELYLELKEQKVAKALLIYLCEYYRPLFEDLWPKHGIVPPVGINFRALSAKDLKSLELPLRLRHEYLLVSFELATIEVLALFELGLSPVVLAEETSLVLPEEPPEIDLPAGEGPLSVYLRPLATGRRGFLYEPLVSYLSLITRVRATEDHLLRPATSELFAQLRQRYPEPFGLLPED